MRTNLELIGELEQEAANFDLVAIALEVEDLVEFVFNSDQRKVEVLGELMTQGARPIGFIGTQTEVNTLCVRWLVLEEYKDDPWAEAYLKSSVPLFLRTTQRPGSP